MTDVWVQRGVWVELERNWTERWKGNQGFCRGTHPWSLGPTGRRDDRGINVSDSGRGIGRWDDPTSPVEGGGHGGSSGVSEGSRVWEDDLRRGDVFLPSPPSPDPYQGRWTILGVLLELHHPSFYFMSSVVSRVRDGTVGRICVPGVFCSPGTSVSFGGRFFLGCVVSRLLLRCPVLQCTKTKLD